jgi:hypothetical protein
VLAGPTCSLPFLFPSLHLGCFFPSLAAVGGTAAAAAALLLFFLCFSLLCLDPFVLTLLLRTTKKRITADHGEGSVLFLTHYETPYPQRRRPLHVLALSLPPS